MKNISKFSLYQVKELNCHSHYFLEKDNDYITETFRCEIKQVENKLFMYN